MHSSSAGFDTGLSPLRTGRPLLRNIHLILWQQAADLTNKN
jgi:hypothetical protein